MHRCIRCLIASLGLLSSIASASDFEVSKIRCSEAGANFAAKFKAQHVTDVSVWGSPRISLQRAVEHVLGLHRSHRRSLHKEVNAVGTTGALPTCTATRFLPIAGTL